MTRNRSRKRSCAFACSRVSTSGSLRTGSELNLLLPRHGRQNGPAGFGRAGTAFRFLGPLLCRPVAADHFGNEDAGDPLVAIHGGGNRDFQYLAVAAADLTLPTICAPRTIPRTSARI